MPLSFWGIDEEEGGAEVGTEVGREGGREGEGGTTKRHRERERSRGKGSGRKEGATKGPCPPGPPAGGDQNPPPTGTVWSKHWLLTAAFTAAVAGRADRYNLGVQELGRPMHRHIHSSCKPVLSRPCAFASPQLTPGACWPNTRGPLVRTSCSPVLTALAVREVQSRVLPLRAAASTPPLQRPLPPRRYACIHATGACESIAMTATIHIPDPPVTNGTQSSFLGKYAWKFTPGLQDKGLFAGAPSGLVMTD